MNGQKKYSIDEVDKMYGYDQNISTYETTQPIQQTYDRQESIKIREKQIMDFLPDFVKDAYNKSITGLSDQLLSGEKRFDLGRYDPSVLEDLGSTITSFFMPADLLTFIGSSTATLGVGGFAAKAGAKTALNRAIKLGSRKLIQSGVKKDLAESVVNRGAKKLVEQSLTQGGAFAGYTGVSTFLREKIEGGDVDYSDILTKSAKAGLAGGIGGAAFGRALGRKGSLGMAYAQEGIAFGTAEPLLEGEIPEPMDYVNSLGFALGLTGGRAAAVKANKYVKTFLKKEKIDESTVNNNLTLEDINAHHQVAKEFAGVRWENEGRGGKRWNRVAEGDGAFSQVRVVGRSISGKGKDKKDSFKIIDDVTKKQKTVDRDTFFKSYKESNISRQRTEAQVNELGALLGYTGDAYVKSITRNIDKNVSNISDRMLNDIHQRMFKNYNVNHYRKQIAEFSSSIPKKDLFSHVFGETIASEIKSAHKAFPDPKARGIIYSMKEIDDGIILFQEKSYQDVKWLTDKYSKFSESRKNRIWDEINGKAEVTSQNKEIVNYWKNMYKERLKYAENSGIVPAGFIDDFAPHYAKAGVIDEIYESIMDIEKASGFSFAENTVNAAESNRIGNIIKDRIINNQNRRQFAVAIDDIIRQYKKKGIVKDYTDAFLMLRNDIRPTKVNRHGSIENKREFDFPEELLERDLVKVTAVYDLNLPRRAETAKVWGRNNEAVDKIISTIKDPRQANRIRTLVDRMTGVSEFQPNNSLGKNYKKFADAVMGFETTTKIAGGSATLANVFQGMYSILPAVGYWNSTKGLASLLNKEFRDSLPTMHKEVISEILGEATSTSFFRKMAEKSAKWSGFTFINKFNNLWASSTAYHAIQDFTKIIDTNPNSITGRRAKARMKNLFEIDYKSGTGLSEDKLALAVSKFAKKTQLHVDLLNEPIAFSNPKLRPFIMFKRFAFKQPALLTKNIKDELFLRDEKGKYIGSPMILFRVATGGMVAASAYQYAKGNLTALLSGKKYEPKEDEGMKNFIENMASVGSFGMLTDFIAAENLSRQIAFTISPPFVGDIDRAIDSFSELTRSVDTFGFNSISVRRAAYKASPILGTKAKHLSRRFIATEGQKRSAQSSAKGRRRKEVHELLIAGNSSLAIKKVKAWNSANRTNPLTFDDISYKSIYKSVTKKNMRVKTEEMTQAQYRAYQEYMRD